MIDTHVHLNNTDLSRDLDGVIARAEGVGVSEFVVVGWNTVSSHEALTLARRDARVWAVVGTHPHDAKAWSEATAQTLTEWAADPRVVAIGEIGLDFYRDLSPRPDQYAAFHAQLALARAANLPIVIHCRDAYDELIPLLESAAPTAPVVLHCFAGDRAHAEVAWRNGWFLGVGGTVTYKKNDALREIVRDTPQALILLETDAPYLSPEPFRGKTNEPARLPLVAACIAQVRGETGESVAAYTVSNTRRAFPRMAPA